MGYPTRRPISSGSASPSLKVQFLLAATLAFFLSVFWYGSRGESVSITGEPEMFSVKSGVLTIAPGAPSDSVLELGNAGRDIASTGPIYLRPERTTAGSKFSQNAADGTQDLYLTGDLTVNGTISLDGITHADWPSGGDPYWDLNGSVLQPTNAGYGVSAFWGAELYGDDASQPTLVASNPGGNVADLGFSGLNVYGNLTATNDITSQGGLPTNPAVPVYRAGNDGRGSGLGADFLDGSDVSFIRCVDSSGSSLYCQFPGFGGPIQYFCRIRHDINPPGPRYYCATMTLPNCPLSDTSCVL